MKAYSLKKAKEIVRVFNEARTAELAAERLNMPVRDIKQIVTWLDTYDSCNAARENSDRPHVVAIPTSRIWLLYLYEHNISPRIAAACVCAPLDRVLQSCGGQDEWVKPCGRRSLATPRKKDRVRMERDPDDPTPEEIFARAAALRSAWPESRLLANERRGQFSVPRNTAFSEVKE